MMYYSPFKNVFRSKRILSNSYEFLLLALFVPLVIVNQRQSLHIMLMKFIYINFHFSLLLKFYSADTKIMQHLYDWIQKSLAFK